MICDAAAPICYNDEYKACVSVLYICLYKCLYVYVCGTECVNELYVHTYAHIVSVTII